MKKIILLVMSVILISLNACECQSCCTKPKSEANVTADACDKCGKTSCSRDCSAGTAEKVMPSCSLDAKAQKERGNAVISKTLNQVKTVKELPDGYDFAFTYSTEMVTELNAIADFERKCCASFTWEVVEDVPQNLVHLKVFGSTDIKNEVKSGFEKMGLAALFK